MSLDIENIRRLYPVAERWAYLNHAASSPLSTRVRDAMVEDLQDITMNGTVNYEQRSARLEAAHRAAATLIGAEPAEVVWTGNTSEGLLIVANGLDWQPGDHIVTASIEFPANVYPWKFVAERKGLEVRFVPGRQGRILLEDLAAAMDHHTRLVALSFVQFATGFRIDLARVAELCRQYNAYLCVDAIQGLGALPLNVREMGIDFLATGGHKWLLGPHGTGFFYARRELIEQLTPVFAGWTAVEDADDFYRFDSPLCKDARRFQTGSRNVVGLLGLGASIATLLEIGPQNIEKHLLALTDHLIEGLKRRGYTVLTPHQSPAERSGIVCFSSPLHKPADIHARLLAAGVVVSDRGDRVRAAPHCYNHFEDIDQLLEALP